jgi:hypothetical protein
MTVEEVQGALRWSAKLPAFKIRLLYTKHAEGLLDDDLLDEVAKRLWERSRDIALATDAFRGRATCPRCGTSLPHDGTPRTLLSCVCGFQMQWRAYKRSFRDRELWGGNATPYFRSFVEELPRARTPAEKVILVDRVVHAAHVSLREGVITRRAVSNLIEGTSAEVLRLLEGLAYGPRTEPELRQTYEEWRALAHRSGRGRVGKPTKGGTSRTF